MGGANAAARRSDQVQRDRQLWRARQRGLLLTLLFALLTAHFWGAGKGPFERLELAAIDLRQRLRAQTADAASTRPEAAEVIVVGLTDACLVELGRPPLPRNCYAQAINFLSRCGADVICLDVLFDPTGESQPDDEALSRAIREAGNVILPVFNYGHHGSVRTLVSGFAEDARAIAHINVVTDRDGIVRRVPPSIVGWHGGAEATGARARAASAHRYPAMSLAAVGLLWRGRAGHGREAVSFPEWREAWYFTPPPARTAVVPLRRVLRQQTPAPEDVALFRGKIVIIGQTADGLPNSDVRYTSTGACYGVFVQKAVVESLLTGELPWRPSANVTVAVLAVAGGIAGILLFGGRRRLMLGTFAALSLLLVVVSLLVFLRFRLLLEVVPLFAVLGFAYAVGLLDSFRYARREIETAESVLASIDESSRDLSTLRRLADARLNLFLGLGASGEQDGRVWRAAVADNLARAVGAEGAVLALRGAERDGLELFGSSAAGEAALAGVRRALESDGSHESPFMAAGPSGLPDGLAELVGVRTAIGVPIRDRAGGLGAAVFWNKRDRRGRLTRFTAADVRLADIVAQEAILSIAHGQLGEQLQSMFTGFVLSLAASIDAKDPYTHGHSDRVAAYAVALAEAVGMAIEEQAQLRLAGLLHDIGKLGVSDAIIRKQGGLSGDERSEMELHPIVADAILEPVAELQALRPAIRGHHERWDGMGYPDRLVGKAACLGARLIAIADSFDAMTTDRPYRPARSFADAGAEVQRCAGTQFDPELAAAFVERALPQLLGSPDGPPPARPEASRASVGTSA